MAGLSAGDDVVSQMSNQLSYRGLVQLPPREPTYQTHTRHTLIRLCLLIQWATAEAVAQAMRHIELGPRGWWVNESGITPSPRWGEVDADSLLIQLCLLS